MTDTEIRALSDDWDAYWEERGGCAGYTAGEEAQNATRKPWHDDSEATRRIWHGMSRDEKGTGE